MVNRFLSPLSVFNMHIQRLIIHCNGVTTCVDLTSPERRKYVLSAPEDWAELRMSIVTQALQGLRLRQAKLFLAPRNFALKEKVRQKRAERKGKVRKKRAVATNFGCRGQGKRNMK